MQRSCALREALDHFTSTQSRLQIVYATDPAWASRKPKHIAVLDASFNPPTHAHLALASMPLIPDDPHAAFDTHLLIFSVRNADKGSGRPGDATALQRLEMMELFAKQLERDVQRTTQKDACVAIALVNEPLVFSKSTLVRDYFGAAHSPFLYWLMGSDTITRVFQARYYGSEQALNEKCEQFFRVEQSTILCAQRSSESVHDGTQRAAHSDDDQARALAALLEKSGPCRNWAAQLNGRSPFFATWFRGGSPGTW
ncbi:hypothetical protein MVES_000242 [Malassezia vespertilionis]|uniref:Nicotinamide-nucleotide adenylyltransferase n=1 Tax=Malassezia vespertilionis TaxID=2020962 RepID=A0A2N1JGL8_9BASI|nr:hypothetical protein MVES_000242 [Malassezia vespertilionis]